MGQGSLLDTVEANGVHESAHEASATAEKLENGDTSASLEVREQLNEEGVAECVIANIICCSIGEDPVRSINSCS